MNGMKKEKPIILFSLTLLGWKGTKSFLSIFFSINQLFAAIKSSFFMKFCGHKLV